MKLSRMNTFSVEGRRETTRKERSIECEYFIQFNFKGIFSLSSFSLFFFRNPILYYTKKMHIIKSHSRNY